MVGLCGMPQVWKGTNRMSELGRRSCGAVRQVWVANQTRPTFFTRNCVSLIVMAIHFVNLDRSTEEEEEGNMMMHGDESGGAKLRHSM